MTAERSQYEKTLIFLLRVSLGWVFLWAGFRQVFMTSNWSAGVFLEHAQSFQGFFNLFTAPAVIPIVSFLVKWGHLLLGISLVLGVAVRLSGVVGAMLMILYYLPRLHFPYVDQGVTNLIVEYHLVYALGYLYLSHVRAGEVWGLQHFVENLPALQPLFDKAPVLRRLAA